MEDGIKTASKSEILGINRFREREESVRGVGRKKRTAQVNDMRGPLVSSSEREAGVKKLGFGPAVGRVGRAQEGGKGGREDDRWGRGGKGKVPEKEGKKRESFP